MRAFGQLGPLTGVFPRSAAVQFHLGLLLLYVGERAKAAKHLSAAARRRPEVALRETGQDTPNKPWPH